MDRLLCRLNNQFNTMKGRENRILTKQNFMHIKWQMTRIDCVILKTIYRIEHHLSAIYYRITILLNELAASLIRVQNTIGNMAEKY